MNPKLAKTLLKAAILGLSIIAHGTIVKLEKKAHETVDEHYPETSDEQNN